MIKLGSAFTECAVASATALATIPVTDFVRRWRDLVGEPPAAILDDRSDMIRLLIQCAPVIEPTETVAVAGPKAF